MKKIMTSFLIAVFCFCTLSLSACATWEGLGKDLQEIGKRIEKAGNKSDEK